MTIRDMRLARGWTQAQLGAKVGLAQNSVSQHETGKTEPSMEEWRRYVAVFGVPLADLLSGQASGEVPGPEAIEEAIHATAQALDRTAQALDKAAEAMRMAAEAHLLLVKRYAEGQTKGE
jgi:transcriptional regulator with XRE-family HTH domain